MMFFLVLSLFLHSLVHGQDSSVSEGFIRIDCGSPRDYSDTITGIYYNSDAKYTSSGRSRNITSKYRSRNGNPRMDNLRSFPDGTRNCYTLRPKQGKNNKYLITAWFLYGNYDGKKAFPVVFDIYVGNLRWDMVLLDDTYVSLSKEIMYVSTTDYIHVCLVNTGSGTPLISALEIRHVKDSIYKSRSRGMALYGRYDMGPSQNSGQPYRYDDDELDRLWYIDYPKMYTMEKTESTYTYTPIDSLSRDEYGLPPEVMQLAVKPQNTSRPMKYYWDEDTQFFSNLYIYLHFCAVEKLGGKELREFDILVNDVPWVNSAVPAYLKTTTITREDPISGALNGQLQITLVRTNRSTLPPILNAMEIYMEKVPQQESTNPEDVDAMVNISLAYGVKRNWQGDPCVPTNISWSGLSCSNDSDRSPHVILLNLSSSGLTGEIPPALANLKSLEYLDLSSNSLTGPVPEFLSQLPALKYLNLRKNNLEGSIPQSLNQKPLLLSLDENPNLCLSVCDRRNRKKSNRTTIIIVISAAVSSIACLIAISICWGLKTRKQKGRTLKSKNQRFSYSEIVKITNNFESVIGKGGFGTVYLGCLEGGTEVAVKMLSQPSIQGSQQLWAEAELLTTIHHRNLVSLIGYSDEGANTALICEYMANGNLQENLSDKRKVALSWELRLQIALDAAQALEYLHNGCKPPIIHRDIKTANILLNEKMQAKVADFGLSRIFPVEDGTHVLTKVMGTLGYLDPEYYITGRLTEKSDVYSFGVVLLELITGRPAIMRSDENIHVVHWVMPMLERGDIESIVDKRLEGDYNANSLWKILETGIACAESNPTQRPTMSQVVGELKECLTMYVSDANTLCRTEFDSKMTSAVGDYEMDRLKFEPSMSCPQAR